MKCLIAKDRRVNVTSLKEVRSALAHRRVWPTCEGREVKYCARKQQFEDGEVSTFYSLGCPVHDDVTSFMEKI